MASVGVPIKLLHEAIGHAVVIEMKNGELYRGHLDQAEDNMNVMLSKVQHTARDSRVSELSNVFLRGSQIRFVQLPEILKDAPMFKKVQATAAKAKPFARGGRGRGRGRGGA